MPGARNSVVKSSSWCGLGAGTLILAGVMLLPAGALGATRLAAHRVGAHRVAAHEVVSRPHVYLMRGLLNIFSLGMDQLAA
ncbi:MAG: hypothetical protein WAL39_04125, partial [Xanthobacteraceae bacterium]